MSHKFQKKIIFRKIKNCKKEVHVTIGIRSHVQNNKIRKSWMVHWFGTNRNRRQFVDAAVEEEWTLLEVVKVHYSI